MIVACIGLKSCGALHFVTMNSMRYLIAFLALAGLLVSVLALRVHYSTGTEPCSINEKWDCGVVNHSPFAEMYGVPVAVLGIAGYLVLGGLGFARQRFLLFLATLAGLGIALRLTFIEEYVLQVWCVYCVISQAIIGLLTILSLGWLAKEYLELKRASKTA
jgi:vitamin-K-epoxide reductase (warfarin-sensitive)